MLQPPDSPEQTCDDVIARLEEQLAAAQETCVAQQSKIDRAMELLSRDVIDRVPETYKFLQTINLAALHENNARVLEAFGDKVLEQVSFSDADNPDFERGKEAVAKYAKGRAAEYRAKVAT